MKARYMNVIDQPTRPQSSLKAPEKGLDTDTQFWHQVLAPIQNLQAGTLNSTNKQKLRSRQIMEKYYSIYIVPHEPVPLKAPISDQENQVSHASSQDILCNSFIQAIWNYWSSGCRECKN
jgi:hypothetical protein